MEPVEVAAEAKAGAEESSDEPLHSSEEEDLREGGRAVESEAEAHEEEKPAADDDSSSSESSSDDFPTKRKKVICAIIAERGLKGRSAWNEGFKIAKAEGLLPQPAAKAKAKAKSKAASKRKVEDADAGEKVQDADEKVEAPAKKKVRGREPKEDTVKLLQKIYSGGELDTLTELKAAKVAQKTLDRQVTRLTQAGKSADAVQANSVKVRRAILAGHEKLQLPVTKGIHGKKADAIKAIEAIVEDADALAEDGARERKRGDELEQKVAALEAELARLRGGAA
jgi:hypothetical protein